MLLKAEFVLSSVRQHFQVILQIVHRMAYNLGCCVLIESHDFVLFFVGVWGLFIWRYSYAVNKTPPGSNDLDDLLYRLVDQQIWLLLFWAIVILTLGVLTIKMALIYVICMGRWSYLVLFKICGIGVFNRKLCHVWKLVSV